MYYTYTIVSYIVCIKLTIGTGHPWPQWVTTKPSPAPMRKNRTTWTWKNDFSRFCLFWWLELLLWKWIHSSQIQFNHSLTCSSSYSIFKLTSQAGRHSVPIIKETKEVRNTATWSPQQHHELSNIATGARSPQHSNVEREFSNAATWKREFSNTATQ
jgi:hypothetical protein